MVCLNWLNSLIFLGIKFESQNGVVLQWDFPLEKLILSNNQVSFVYTGKEFKITKYYSTILKDQSNRDEKWLILLSKLKEQRIHSYLLFS